MGECRSISGSYNQCAERPFEFDALSSIIIPCSMIIRLTEAGRGSRKRDSLKGTKFGMRRPGRLKTVVIRLMK